MSLRGERYDRYSILMLTKHKIIYLYRKIPMTPYQNQGGYRNDKQTCLTQLFLFPRLPSNNQTKIKQSVNYTYINAK